MSAILQNFHKPDIDSRGMFRCWFPDAGADLDRIENHVKTIYNAGFGGMEIAMVPQYADFDAREYGWATPRWKEMLRRILKTAAGLPEPFKIDLTITAHWPPSLNTIELRLATTLINRLRISHPLFDGKGGMPAPPSAPEGADAGAMPLEKLMEENDYELPGAPMDMPVPSSGDYRYGLYKVTVTPYCV